MPVHKHIIIGLVGQKGAGKSSLTETAQTLQDRVQGGARISRYSIGEHIANILVSIGVHPAIAFNKELWNEPIMAFGGRTAREMSWEIGTAMRTLYGEEVFIRAAHAQAKQGARAPWPVVSIIDDIRTLAEVKYMEKIKRDCYLVAVNREGQEAPHGPEDAAIHVLQEMCSLRFVNEGKSISSDGARFWNMINREILNNE